MRTYGLVVYGHPLPSVRITARGKWSPAARRYLGWQQQIADHCKPILAGGVAPFSKDITLELVFYFCKRKHGDLTNLIKAAEDGLQHGGLIVNDRAVRRIIARLDYCKMEAHERVEIVLGEASE